jgi:flagellar hook-length control protein FliK
MQNAAPLSPAAADLSARPATRQREPAAGESAFGAVLDTEIRNRQHASERDPRASCARAHGAACRETAPTASEPPPPEQPIDATPGANDAPPATSIDTPVPAGTPDKAPPASAAENSPAAALTPDTGSPDAMLALITPPPAQLPANPSAPLAGPTPESAATGLARMREPRTAVDSLSARPAATKHAAVATADALVPTVQGEANTLHTAPAAATAQTGESAGPSTPAVPAPATPAAAPFALPGSTAEKTASSALAPYVGSSAWGHALGERIVWMAGQNQQTATLTLNPPDLGPLQVVVSVQNDQASASFHAHQPEVRQALEAALPRLRDMMSEAGIQLGQAMVSADTPRQQDFGANRQTAFSGGPTRSEAAESGQETDPVIHLAPARAGRIDTFA